MSQDFLALLGIVIAGVVAIGSQPGRFTTWETIIGIILFDLLFCINRTGFNTFVEKFAFSSTVSLCLMIIFGFLIEKLLDKCRYFDIHPKKEESEKRHLFFFGLWVLLSFFLLLMF